MRGALERSSDMPRSTNGHFWDSAPRRDFLLPAASSLSPSTLPCAFGSLCESQRALRAARRRERANKMLCSTKDIISEWEEYCGRFRDSPRSTMTTFGLSPQVRFSSSYRLFAVFRHFRPLVGSLPGGLTRPGWGMVARKSKQNVAFAQEHHCRGG